MFFTDSCFMHHAVVVAISAATAATTSAPPHADLPSGLYSGWLLYVIFVFSHLLFLVFHCCLFVSSHAVLSHLSPLDVSLNLVSCSCLTRFFLVLPLTHLLSFMSCVSCLAFHFLYSSSCLTILSHNLVLCSCLLLFSLTLFSHPSLSQLFHALVSHSCLRFHLSLLSLAFVSCFCCSL